MNPLIEPGVSYSFMKSLKQCHEIKINYRSVMFNFILLGVFIIVTAGFLYYKHKTKPTPKDKKRKLEEDRLYILGKLKSLQLEKNHSMNGLITNLPLHNFA